MSRNITFESIRVLVLVSNAFRRLNIYPGVQWACKHWERKRSVTCLKLLAHICLDRRRLTIQTFREDIVKNYSPSFSSLVPPYTWQYSISGPGFEQGTRGRKIRIFTSWAKFISERRHTQRLARMSVKGLKISSPKQLGNVKLCV
jgi:hypothetical protein